MSEYSCPYALVLGLVLYVHKSTCNYWIEYIVMNTSSRSGKMRSYGFDGSLFRSQNVSQVLSKSWKHSFEFYWLLPFAMSNKIVSSTCHTDLSDFDYINRTFVNVSWVLCLSTEDAAKFESDWHGLTGMFIPWGHIEIIFMWTKSLKPWRSFSLLLFINSWIQYFHNQETEENKETIRGERYKCLWKPERWKSRIGGLGSKKRCGERDLVLLIEIYNVIFVWLS